MGDVGVPRLSAERLEELEESLELWEPTKKKMRELIDAVRVERERAERLEQERDDARRELDLNNISRAELRSQRDRYRTQVAELEARLGRAAAELEEAKHERVESDEGI